jgi:RNA-binding protein
MEETLKGNQRAALMKQAHHLQPVAVVGKHGLTPEVKDHVDRELHRHELIKVRFVDYKEVRREITEELSRELKALLVAVIGNVGILYRPADDPEDRRITLP